MATEYTWTFPNFEADSDDKVKTIILLYENEIHFKLVGYFQNGQMGYYFNH